MDPNGFKVLKPSLGRRTIIYFACIFFLHFLMLLYNRQSQKDVCLEFRATHNRGIALMIATLASHCSKGGVFVLFGNNLIP